MACGGESFAAKVKGNKVTQGCDRAKGPKSTLRMGKVREGVVQAASKYNCSMYNSLKELDPEMTKLKR